ncbi:MAG: TonB-dependent receptor [Bacteroidia bacterium]|nr:TonB-dependent receptor [Bacteroidia bacterium]
MRAIFFVAALFIGLSSFAQTVINGTVTDDNGEPIPGVNVIVIGTTDGAVADFNGTFVIETSETPPFQIRFTNLGYGDVIVEITSSNQTVAVTMAEAQTILDEIIVSASRTPERIFESPVSVERFGLKEIKNTSAESFYSGLQNLKGVDINTNSLTFQSINTRGFATFANTRFLQLVDGMDNSAPGLNFVLGNLVGMSELEVQSVEILPGASSALYGAGAFNGILFMNSKNPFDYQGISAYGKVGLTVQEAAGDNNYYDFGIRAAHAFSDKFAVKANFSFLKGEDWHANSQIDVNDPSRDRSNIAYDGRNVYGDEVGTLLNFDAAAGLPSGTVGSAFVTRTGYQEGDLANYNAESVKTDFSVHYKPWANDFELLYNGRVGRGNTIYQGTNRYSVANFIMQQHKFEVRNNNFFVRGYLTSENAGDSYDTRFTAININRRWKSDVDWFTDYATTFIGARLGVGTGVMLDEATAHAAARAAADTGRFVPGSPQFQRAFEGVTNDGDLTTGSKFIDNTKVRHVDANYNFSHITSDFADIQLGGSYREYELNSQGTIFTDIDGPISYNEYGAYMQLQKKLMDERLKITGSVRYDKNEFFDGFFSPRISLLYNFGELKNQNLRVSYQKGFRNPTTQDLFIGLDAGAAVLVGSAPDNLDRDIRTFDLTPSGQALTGMPTAQVVGRAAYENAYSVSSVLAGAPMAVNTPIVKPEEISAYEVGYRAQFGQIAIDISAYYNEYTDFLSQTNVFVPFYGQAGDGGLSLLALQNGDRRVYLAYTNSPTEVQSIGATVGIEAKVFKDFDIGANYTYADLDFDQATFPDFRTNFNTPEHKFKAFFGNTELFENFGFRVNYRWSDEYLWQASFADGTIPSYSILDAQFTYNVPSFKSSFKIGGSNILGEEYISAIGTGSIGSIYYVSWTINP